MIRKRIDQDLKQAMLAGDKAQVSVLRGLKSSIQYAQVAKSRDDDLTDAEVIQVMQREAKKRGEAAELYKNNGDEGRAAQEQSEKEVIEQYLPKQLNEDEVNKIIDEVVVQIGPLTKQTMGQAIGLVKAKSGGAAEGSVIARLVQARL